MSARTAPPAGARPGPALPLVVTADPDLLDDLVRLAAAAGTEVDVAADPAAARSRYLGAALVLVGADQAVACLRAHLPRRSRTAVVGHEPIVHAAWEVAESLGAEHVAMLPAAEPWLTERFAAAARAEPPPAGRVLAVLGGRGGAGASILAGGLAVTAAREARRTLLLDADPLGGGLDLVLGWEQDDGLRWPALAEAGAHADPAALLKALPHRGDLVLLSFARDAPRPVPPQAMAVTMQVARDTRDVTVVDLPRHLDDAATLALAAADQTLLIVPAELRATAAAARVAAIARVHCAALSVVVRGPAPSRLKAREVARSLGLPLAGALRPEPGVCQRIERGVPPAVDGRGPLAELCAELLAQLSVVGEAA
ncbi:secretion/DNA translocation related CpaE-like protein [Pseudosporangium ferrugineum]|uniref:Secretion/DNA translocation related CpaE-like protein n=1 Tax=Pseudosporangium ferrugineum TaxID=439699 RepID=A0A2T0S7Q5_9ACTN|nr:secretion/DNA translocation related CpaE-like protein [Pseudosporangium ferrugineum]